MLSIFAIVIIISIISVIVVDSAFSRSAKNSPC